ncbi:MAG TPA: amino acid permease [Gemmatimonadales bacterium]
MTSPTGYRRSLGLFSGTMAVVGGIIGSGIFMNSAIVAQRVGTAGLTLSVWILGGVIALIGAFCFGELAQRNPQAGGSYVYLRDAFGPLPAFLYAWSLLLVIGTGAMAAVAVTFATYCSALLGLSHGTVMPIAAGAIAILSAVNYVGVEPGAITNNLFSILKLIALGGLIVAGLLAAPAAVSPPPVNVSGSLFLALAAALVPVLFAYGGWQQTNFIAEEIVEPEKNLPRALVFGVIIVVVVYVLANLTYLRTLGAGGLAASTAPAADAMRVAVGPVGSTFISAGIAASSFGFLNLVILVSPRVYRTMAADGLFFPRLAKLHPKFRTPSMAIVVQGLWAILLLFSGSYGQLLDYVVFCDWIFFGSAVAALFVYRRRDREAGREPAPAGSFRVPGYPVTPLLFVAAAVYVVAGSISSNPGNALRGSVILAAGVPVFGFWSRKLKGRGIES